MGPLAALASSFTWAIGVGVYSKLSRQHSAFLINSSRAAVALPLFLLSVLVMGGGFSGFLKLVSVVNAQHVGWFTLSMLASYALGDALFLWSARIVGVPGALAIASSYPFWSALVGWGINGEALSLGQFLGLVAVVSGTVLVILAGYREHGSRRPIGAPKPALHVRFGVGVALGFVTSLCWALNTFAVSRGGIGLTAPVANVCRMAIALVLCPAFGILFSYQQKRTRPRIQVLLPLPQLRASLPIFAIEGFGGSLSFIYGITHSPLAVGSALSSLAPVISVVIAWITRTERFSLSKTLGVLLVVGGVVLLV